MTARAPRRPFIAAVAGFAVALSGLAVVTTTAPAQASVSSKISTFPYVQDWSTLTPTSTWADFPGVEGFTTGTTISPANQPNTTDVGTLTAEGTLTSSLVPRTGNTPNTDTSGGVLTYAGATNKTVALSATGAFTTPLLAFHLDTTGRAAINVAYDLQDLDSSADDQPTRVALQYRVGTSGSYTNVPGAYVPDATGVSNSTVTSIPVSAALPSNADNKPDVYVRVITLDNATGSNEHIGIDNIVIQEGTPGPTPLSATNPGNKSSFVNTPITPITLSASGGTTPYSWSVTGLPAGLTETITDGKIEGTPTETGSFPVSATVTDSATPTAGTATVNFTITVQAAPQMRTIAEIQGTGAASPEANNTVITQGVVTASYPSGTGDLAGFYLQTGGPDATPNASDAIFVFMGAKTSPAIGTTVQVTGKVTEFFGTTEISPSFASDVITTTAQPAVVPGDVIPGTDCALPGTACLTGAALDAAREAHEGELFQPTGDYTVTDSYDGSPFTQSGSAGFAFQGEIGIAAESDQPLMVTTEVVDQSDTAGLAARVAYNDAHKLILDDGADIDYTSAANEDTPYPWLTPSHPVRVGAPVTFPQPVVLWNDFGFWRIQPQTKVAGGQDGQDRVAIQNTRTAAPTDVLSTTGDLKIATFNMLNYFNTLGEDWAASDGVSTGNPSNAYIPANPRRCSYFTDRGPVPPATGSAARITNDECAEDAVDPLTGLNVKNLGPRGAANQANFKRQEDKELEAINTIDADVMSLEEVENSIKLYSNEPPIVSDPADANRDDAVSHLVGVLNTHWANAHPGYVGPRWAFAPSPRPEALPSVAEQDAIRSAFIYNPSKVELVGASQVLVNSAPFRNAREPLAQAFKPLGGGREDAFIVVVNHLKSKGGPTAPATVNGDNVDAGDGAGFYNGDRKRQAAALVDFAQQVSSNKNIGPVFFTGDFNAYAKEDPVQVIEAAGYTSIESSDGETTYSFGGLAGSLDHVFANTEALAMVTGEDVWSINANESVYYEYSRYNANATDLYAVNPYRSSDHNPEIIGIDVGDNIPDPVVDTVQILATNDFHGRIVDDPGSAAAGAASMAGAVKELRDANSSTIFAAAGDLIGASTFESFIQDDEPTIDALNEAGLEVSSVGNHEFDKGFDDLLTRVMPRATWKYLGANVEYKDTENGHAAGAPALPETWCRTLPNGRVVGFVGAVTEDLETLVSASAIEDVVITDIVDAVNEHADDLKGPDGCGAGTPADLVIELVHEGAATTSVSSVTDNSTFGQIVAGADENVDAIVSGHTHLAYNHKVTVPEWAGRTVTKRPVVSAGQYGANLNRLQFEFAPGGGDLVNIRQTVLQLKDYAPDQDTQDIVDDAVDFAETAGDLILGEIQDDFLRARRVGDDGQIVENRGGESTLGNLISEMQRWKTEADIGFMNPGGLRADLLGLPGTPLDVTYRQAANTQPFANTLVTMDLTGAQIKELLEQQWQRDADGNIPSRPFLRLGTSAGFTSTFDASKDEGSRITGMWLDGTPIDPAATYKVSATSFLAGAGDNFWAFADGTNVQDTGKTDLEAVVDYLDNFAGDGDGTPLPVEYAQHQVGVKVTSAATAPYVAGNALTLDVSSLAMTGLDDTQDTQVELFYGATSLDTSPVTNTLTTDLTDATGTATLTITVPADVGDGTTLFRLVGNNSGTEISVPVQTSDGLANSTVSGANQTIIIGDAGSVPVTVTPETATGSVTLKDGADLIGTLVLDGVTGKGDITVPANSLAVGPHTLTLVYPGDGTNGGATGTVTVTVVKATPTIGATPTPATVTVNGGTSVVAVTVGSGAPGDPTGVVTASVGGIVVDTENLAAGTATLTVGPFATAGDKTVTISYGGDTNTESGTTTATVGVDKVTATVTAAVPNPASVVVNAGTSNIAVTVSATGGNPGGTVTASLGGTVVDTQTLTAGAATLTVGPFATVGAKTVTITYAGDPSTSPGTATTTVTVTESAPTATAITATAAAMTYGTAGNVSATVTPPGATGTVTVRNGATVVGSAALSGGGAQVAIPGTALEPGSHSLTVTYGGDATHASSSTTVTVVVSKAASTTAATASPSTVTVGVDESTVTVVVGSGAGQPTGTVEARVGGTLVDSGSLAGGMATLTVGPFPTVGTKTVTVRYLGDAHIAASQDDATVVVEPAEKLTPKMGVTHTPNQVRAQTTRATLVVGVAAGNQPAAGWVELRIPGTLQGVVTKVVRLAGGRAEVRLPKFKVQGMKRVRVTYKGNAQVLAKSVVHSIRVLPRQR
jgi:predicted extracellular nuclease/2',3'-cyclic-nucleotide 2'-phosphodiesterase (5'-nucleotidase family)